MKNWIFCLVFLASTIIAPVMAAETEKSEREDQFELELRINPGRYTFRKYLADLQESTRVTDIDPKNPVRWLEAGKNPKYEPLNPIALFRW